MQHIASSSYQQPKAAHQRQMQVAGASLGSPVRCRVLGAKRVIVHAPKAPHRPRKAATHVVLQETAVSTAPDQADTSDFLKMVNLEVKSDRQEAVLLQGFGWCSHKQPGWYNILKSKIPEMKAAGITHLWLPPPSQSVAPEGYLPGQLYNLQSSYGNKEELIALNAALKEAGIVPLADIVINHRCADSQDSQGRWNNYHDDVDHDGKSLDWGRWAITCNDHEFGGQGNPDTGADFGGAPDLDHANPELREALCHWLQHLKRDIGFEGWRFDFVKGFAGRFITEYVDKSTGGDALNVGELWVDLDWQEGGLAFNQDGARQAIVNWIDETQQRSTAFDFVTKGILQEAVKNTEYWRLRDNQGKAPGLLGWWPSRSVTFIDNHDTGSSQQHWPFPADKVATGYAYIMTHPGMPCVFWEHLFDWGQEVANTIKTLKEVRHRNGINARSKLEILCADADMYVGRIGDSVTVKLGPRYDMGCHLPQESDGWKFAVSGPEFAVWEKASA
eukprot:jgi/Chrzof1/14788/Cz09g16070.t1